MACIDEIDAFGTGRPPLTDDLKCLGEDSPNLARAPPTADAIFDVERTINGLPVEAASEPDPRPSPDGYSISFVRSISNVLAPANSLPLLQGRSLRGRRDASRTTHFGSRMDFPAKSGRFPESSGGLAEVRTRDGVARKTAPQHVPTPSSLVADGARNYPVGIPRPHSSSFRA